MLSAGVVCISCGQSPDDDEKDLLPEQCVKLHWEKRSKDSQGCRVESSVARAGLIFFSITLNHN